jgi:hypothetical protein
LIVEKIYGKEGGTGGRQQLKAIFETVSKAVFKMVL